MTVACQRTGTPRAARYCLASRMVKRPKWKIDAASTAAAGPSRMPATGWADVPPPPAARPAMGEDAPANGRPLLGIDGDDDALAAEFFRRLGHEIGLGHGRGVDRD